MACSLRGDGLKLAEVVCRQIDIYPSIGELSHGESFQARIDPVVGGEQMTCFESLQTTEAISCG